MLITLEFNYKDTTITKYIDINDLYNDINDLDVFWGEFTLYNETYQFQIFWNACEIAIFEVGGYEPIYYVNGFNLYFNRNFKVY